jgi:hypothetical protein
MDPEEFRRQLCQALHLNEDASEYKILSLVATSYHYYLLNRPAEVATPAEALDITPAEEDLDARKTTPAVSLGEVLEWTEQYSDGTKVLITNITAGHATDLVQEFYGDGPHPCLETGSVAGAWVTVANEKDVSFLASLIEGGYRLEVCQE